MRVATRIAAKEKREQPKGGQLEKKKIAKRESCAWRRK